MASNGSLRNVAGPKKFGLIIPSKANAAKKPGASSSSGGVSFALGMRKANAAFSARDSDDEDAGAPGGDEPVDTISASSAPKGAAKQRVNREVALAQKHQNSNRKIELLHQQALEEDPNVFDYDASYDAMKLEEEARRRKREVGEDGEDKRTSKKPKYVEGIFKAVVARKVYLEQAEEKKVQREREKEGDEFGDKEAFVTEAYKEKMRELRRLEEEERIREEKERASSADMSGFYRRMLEERERTSEMSLSKEEIEALAEEKRIREMEEKREKEGILREALESGQVKLNASDEIVDKRGLLRGGLNVSGAKKRDLEREREEEERAKREFERKRREEEEKERERRREEQERRKAKEAAARRLVAEAVRQDEEERERKKMEEEERLKELAKLMQKKASEETVSDAKRRYLERKKKEAEEKKKKGGTEESDSD
ncbi:hypothetical protein HK101_002566 [Irineochytrium annulatum]|nr:hypothetical protein HK101_002566 [Irineochytrium annulatum]